MAQKKSIPEKLMQKERKLKSALARFGRVLVAYSGGTDSTLLLFEAVAALGSDRVVAVTAVSEVFTPEECKRAETLCKNFKVEHRLLKMDPLKSPRFRANDRERCYHCKHRLLDRLTSLARKLKCAAVIEASQMDDRGDYRPGAKAVKEFKVRSPLMDAGMDKSDVRRLSRYHDLPTADLPAAACLASRVPYGTPISAELLNRIGGAETAIRGLGFRQFRLRHHGVLARLEFAPKEMLKAFACRRALTLRVQRTGWDFVALDLEGYRTGSLNRVLKATGKKKKQGKA